MNVKTKIHNMNIKILSALLPVMVAIFSSCSDAERDGGFSRIAAQSHTVKYKIYSANAGCPNLSKLYIYHDGEDEIFVLNGEWEKKFVTKSDSAKVSAHYMQCDALIDAEIYVDGKLKASRSHNKELEVKLALK